MGGLDDVSPLMADNVSSLMADNVSSAVADGVSFDGWERVCPH